MDSPINFLSLAFPVGLFVTVIAAIYKLFQISAELGEIKELLKNGAQRGLEAGNAVNTIANSRVNNDADMVGAGLGHESDSYAHQLLRQVKEQGDAPVVEPTGADYSLDRSFEHSREEENPLQPRTFESVSLGTMHEHDSSHDILVERSAEKPVEKLFAEKPEDSVAQGLWPEVMATPLALTPAALMTAEREMAPARGFVPVQSASLPVPMQIPTTPYPVSVTPESPVADHASLRGGTSFALPSLAELGAASLSTNLVAGSEGHSIHELGQALNAEAEGAAPKMLLGQATSFQMENTHTAVASATSAEQARSASSTAVAEYSEIPVDASERPAFRLLPPSNELPSPVSASSTETTSIPTPVTTPVTTPNPVTGLDEHKQARLDAQLDAQIEARLSARQSVGFQSDSGKGGFESSLAPFESLSALSRASAHMVAPLAPPALLRTTVATREHHEVARQTNPLELPTLHSGVEEERGDWGELQ